MRVLTDVAPEGCPQVSLAPQRLLFITCTLEQGLSLVRGGCSHAAVGTLAGEAGEGNRLSGGESRFLI